LPQSPHESIGGVILNVEKQNAGFLKNEGLDDGLANSAGASGDENNPPFQAAVDSGG
jgi:hypothetical protein